MFITLAKGGNIFASDLQSPQNALAELAEPAHSIDMSQNMQTFDIARICVPYRKFRCRIPGSVVTELIYI